MFSPLCRAHRRGLQLGTDHGAPACNRPVAAPARTSPVRGVLRQEAVKGGANSTSTASCQGVALDSSASPSTGNLLSGGRRGALVTALLAPATLGCLAGALPAAAVATASPLDVPEGFSSLADATLAYRFIYPTRTASGAPVSPVLTRTPEKYSSAAPLSADARQRIVAELFDLTRFVTVSVTVGPASGVLRDVPQERWSPRDVALTVLIDRSTARLSSGQRTALNDVVETRAEERDGATYYVYEHTSQGSPTVANPRPETFRHALAVTTTRPGLDGTPYLYTLNLSCPQALWDELKGGFRTAVESFELVTPSDSYIPPDKNPWLFF